MGSYILRRTLLVVPIVLGAVTLLFLAFFIVPGDPVQLLAGEKSVTPQIRDNLEAKFGLDQPWHVQYGKFVNRLAHGDLGESYRSGRSVNTILGSSAPASLRLAFWAIVVEVLIGISAGLLSAVKRYSFVDALTTVSTTMLLAVPAFVLGYLLIYMLGVFPFQRGWPAWARLPVQGIGPNSWALGVIPTGNQWQYLMMPVITLASVNTALVARMTRGSMLEIMRSDFMRTAEAGGLPRRQVLFKHGLKNAMIPVVTLIGLNLADLIGSAILTETVFNWPGLGSSIATAITFLDAPIVLGLSLVLVLSYVLINLLVDLSYAFFDPRIRYGGAARLMVLQQSPRNEQTGAVSPAAAILTDTDIGSAPRGEVWRRFRRNKLAVAGLSVIVLMVVAAVFAPVVTRFTPTELGNQSRATPSMEHWFGTDVLGRDMFSRIVYGARVSLRIGIISVSIACAIGLFVGAVTGYYAGKLDGLLMRTTDVFLSFPYILAAIVIITVVGRGEGSVILVLAFLGWMPIARLFRASVIQIKHADYIEAARAVGCSNRRIIARHIVPNAVQPVIVYATIFVGTAVLTEAALSFLGVGVLDPTPAWGLMVNAGRAYLFNSPHLLFFPGAAILVTVMAFVFVGDGLRDALDPRLR